MKADKTEATDLGVSYDYGSIMHYGLYAGSKDLDSPAFQVLKPYDEASIGTAQYFSQADIRKLKLLYGCNDDGPSIPRPISPQPISPQPISPQPTFPISNGHCGCNCGCIGFDCKCNCNCDCSHECKVYSADNYNCKWQCTW